MSTIDVLIITALQEEYYAAYEVALSTSGRPYGISKWDEGDAEASTPYVFGDLLMTNGQSIHVALARPTRMGSVSTSPVIGSLVERLKPHCLAMCGVCAGNPSEVALGDVIIAEMVYQYDEGKQKADNIEGDHRQYPLADTWVRAAQDLSLEGLLCFGNPSEEEAKIWLLERLYAGDNPRNLPSLTQYFPEDTWKKRVQAFEQERLICRKGQQLELTDEGRSFVQETLLYETKDLVRLPFQIKVGPIASGNVVVKDGLTWDKLRQWGVRSVLGLEMEAASIGSTAHRLGVPDWVVVKGVMDHADPRKDDRYKRFAARSSAEVLFKLLSQQLTGSISAPEAEHTVSISKDSQPFEHTMPLGNVVKAKEASDHVYELRKIVLEARRNKRRWKFTWRLIYTISVTVQPEIAGNLLPSRLVGYLC